MGLGGLFGPVSGTDRLGQHLLWLLSDTPVCLSFRRCKAWSRAWFTCAYAYADRVRSLRERAGVDEDF